MDQKTDVTKLWRTIKGIDGRAKREAGNEAITFNGISFSSSKQPATKFNQQFNTSKLGRHTSSRETRVVTRETKKNPLEMVRTFTTDLVVKAIKSCRNSKAFGPDKLSIFHLKHLGPRAIEYITTLFNLSATTCRIPDIWKSSLIIPIPKPGKHTSQRTSYRPISLICPAVKVLESIIFIENSHLPLVKCSRILGVYLDPSLSFNKHSQYVAERVSGRNNILKALAGTSWGQQKETLLMTYKAVGRSIINYAAPVWSPNLHDTNHRKIQYTQTEALRIATGCHKMSSIYHLHTEAEMLKVKEHSELLSAQYLARCLEPGNVCHPITRPIPERQMKETLYTRHRNTVEPMMVKNDRKATFQALHTAAVVKAVQCHERNVVLDGRPPPISNSEKELTRKERSTLAQLGSGYCRLLGSYKSRIKKDANLDVCADCGTTPHDVKHLFVCLAHPTTLIPSDTTD